MKLLFSILLYWNCVAASDDISTDIRFYHSRADLRPPRLHVHHQDSANVAPGYLFVAPWHESYLENGPYILDSDGDLIWSGTGVAGGDNAHGLHVCQFRGDHHLCFYQGNQISATGKGRGVILDTTYQIVANVYSGAGRSPIDMHEFRLTAGGETALVGIMTPVAYDLSQYGFSDAVGWIVECGFQEIDVETGLVRFDWRSLPHIAPSESLTHSNRKSFFTPWDYLHLNSIEKTSEGDYVVSGRHTSTVYKISGVDGGIVWRFGGNASDFKLIDFSIGFQHDVRLVEESSDHTLITLFNNGGDGRDKAVNESSYGALIRLDHSSWKATLLQKFDAEPNGKSHSPNQGNVQYRSDGNVLVNWGYPPLLTEHLSNGTVVFQATLAGNRYKNYRAFKAKWKGNPSGAPSLWTYSRYNSSSSTVFYMSWNGATEISSWRIYARTNQASKPPILIGSTPKSGFETRFTVSSYYSHSFVEAIGWDGSSLGNSSVVATFVPGPKLEKNCTDLECPIDMTEYARDLPRPKSHFYNYVLRNSFRRYQEYTAVLFPFILIFIMRKSLQRLLQISIR